MKDLRVIIDGGTHTLLIALRKSLPLSDEVGGEDDVVAIHARHAV
jgi:hypothetical protein